MLIGCYGSDKWQFACCPSTAIAIMFLAAPIRVINLYQTGKWFAIVTQFHYLLELVFHEKSGIAANTQCS